VSIAAANAALRDADEALGAAKVIRGEAFEALIGAVVDSGWRVVFRHKDAGGHERVVLEHFNGRSAALEDVVAVALREGAAA
jgi:hypothetical protein